MLQYEQALPPACDLTALHMTGHAAVACFSVLFGSKRLIFCGVSPACPVPAAAVQLMARQQGASEGVTGPASPHGAACVNELSWPQT
jgi:hypothetical protein